MRGGGLCRPSRKPVNARPDLGVSPLSPMIRIREFKEAEERLYFLLQSTFRFAHEVSY